MTTSPNTEPNCIKPKTFNEVLAELLEEKTLSGEIDHVYNNLDWDGEYINFSPEYQTAAVPMSLSIDDLNVNLCEVNVTNSNTSFVRTAKTTMVNMPSIVDTQLLERRLVQLDQVMTDLEEMEGFWNRADLLLQDSWLHGYRGSFLEEKQDLVHAAETYNRAVSLYELALKLDRLTSKSNDHILSYYHLLKRYVAVLSDPRLPEETKDSKRVAEFEKQMESIREERMNWSMPSPDSAGEPFVYAATILKVLCV